MSPLDPARVALMGAYYRDIVSCRDLQALDVLRRAGLSEPQAVRMFLDDVRREPIRSRRLLVSPRLQQRREESLLKRQLGLYEERG